MSAVAMLGVGDEFDLAGRFFYAADIEGVFVDHNITCDRLVWPAKTTK